MTRKENNSTILKSGKNAYLYPKKKEMKPQPIAKPCP